jgi:hypothetical protein
MCFGAPVGLALEDERPASFTVTDAHEQRLAAAKTESASRVTLGRTIMCNVSVRPLSPSGIFA